MTPFNTSLPLSIHPGDSFQTRSRTYIVTSVDGADAYAKVDTLIHPWVKDTDCCMLEFSEKEQAWQCIGFYGGSGWSKYNNTFVGPELLPPGFNLNWRNQ